MINKKGFVYVDNSGIRHYQTMKCYISQRNEVESWLNENGARSLLDVVNGTRCNNSQRHFVYSACADLEETGKLEIIDIGADPNNKASRRQYVFSPVSRPMVSRVMDVD
jgi:hypothetical protein